MNTYSRKQQWKTGIFITAAVISLASLWYTNDLVKEIAQEERKRVQIWADAMREVQEADLEQEISLIVYMLIQDNKTIPLIWTDEFDNILTTMNLDSTRLNQDKYLERQMALMKSENPPIEIEPAQGEKQLIYYRDSNLLNQLIYYPLIQLIVIFIFIATSYFAFSSSRKAEQNQVWVGMSKETAHQLGTPISSLLAWVELLKMRDEDSQLVNEVEKDVKRLETITERFSKIGSKPVLKPEDIVPVLTGTIEYLRKRVSKQVHFSVNFPHDWELMVPLNIALFEWVIENLCKNAVDAMNGSGHLVISMSKQADKVVIDISDSGKGIPKSKFKTVFQPGFTTKKRGWGLGLSLAKRIIESYHAGKIFVKDSQINQGTTFRIILPRCMD